MERIGIDDVYQLASDAREAIWEAAEQYGREPKIYLHWTAGFYEQLSDHYHINIKGDGSIYLMNPLENPTSGTWRRNSGAVNVTICGCFDAGSSDLGTAPPTTEQIEVMAQVIGKLAEGLWLTVDKNHVMTHGEAANNEDGYTGAHDPYSWWNDSYGDGDTRGDLEYLGTPESPSYNPWATDGTRGGDVLRGKAAGYVNEWRNKK